jgi:hypothetical protein
LQETYEELEKSHNELTRSFKEQEETYGSHARSINSQLQEMLVTNKDLNRMNSVLRDKLDQTSSIVNLNVYEKQQSKAEIKIQEVDLTRGQITPSENSFINDREVDENPTNELKFDEI